MNKIKNSYKYQVYLVDGGVKMEGNNSNRISKMYFLIFFTLFAILIVITLTRILQLNNVNKLTTTDMHKVLSANCNERYQEVNNDYTSIIQEYIDDILKERNETEFMMLHLNLEKTYTDKVKLSLQDMKNKLESIKANGTRLKSYEHKVLKDKDVFVCKVGINNTLISIFEYQPGIYSFAFDGFVE